MRIRLEWAQEPLPVTDVRYGTPAAAWCAAEPKLAGAASANTGLVSTGRPGAPPRRSAGHGTAGLAVAPRRTGKRGWRTVRRDLITGGFLLCGWLASGAGHANAAVVTAPVAPHINVTGAAARPAAAAARAGVTSGGNSILGAYQVTTLMDPGAMTMALPGHVPGAHRRGGKPESHHEHHENRKHREHHKHQENQNVIRLLKLPSSSQAGRSSLPKPSSPPARVTPAPSRSSRGARPAQFNLLTTTGAVSGMSSISVFALAAAAVLAVAVTSAAAGRRLTGRQTASDSGPTPHLCGTRGGHDHTQPRRRWDSWHRCAVSPE